MRSHEVVDFGGRIFLVLGPYGLAARPDQWMARQSCRGGAAHARATTARRYLGPVAVWLDVRLGRASRVAECDARKFSLCDHQLPPLVREWETRGGDSP